MQGHVQFGDEAITEKGDRLVELDIKDNKVTSLVEITKHVTSINTLCTQGETAILKAANGGHTQIVEMLKKAGASDKQVGTVKVCTIAVA